MRLALLILLFACSGAQAGPILQVVQIAAPFIPGVGQAISIALMAFSFAYSMVTASNQKKAEQRAAAAQAAKAEAQRQAYNASLQDRTITHVASDAPAVFIYGRARVGSLIAAMFTSGDKDQYRWLVCVVAAHECDAFEEGYINGNALGLGSLDGSGNVTTGKYTNQVQIHTHLGTPTDPVDAALNTTFSTQWPSTAVLRGHAYAVIRLDLNQSEFQSGLPDIQWLMRGKKLYDPRSATTYWSMNPALAVMDYLTSEICNVPYTDLPEAYFITAANVCDEAQTFGNLYTCNGTVTADQDQVKVLEMLTQSMGGGIESMTWSIWAGKYVAPVLALSQSDIVGKVSATPGISDADIFNGVKGQAITAANQYIATDFEPYQNAAYVAADGGKEKWTNINFPFTDDKQRIWNLARIATEDQRNGFTIQADFSYKAWKLKVGERVTFDSAFFGQTAKVYRVTDRAYSPTAPVTLTLKEDDPTIWDFADAVTADSTPNTNLGDPWHVPPIQIVTCSSGTASLLRMSDGTIVSRILVEWPAVNKVTIDAIDIEWQKSGSSIWEATQVRGDQTSAYASPVDDGAVYSVRVRGVNRYLNSPGEWTTVTHTVVGKIQPPADMQNLSIDGSTLSWTPNNETDFDGSRFRFHYGANFDWGSANPLHNGLIMSSPYTPTTLPGGVITIMGKNVDTSGNESVNTANIVTNLLDPAVANIVETFDWQELGFSGTKTNCSVVTGQLVADALDSFYGTDSQSAYGLDNDSFYASSSFAQMVYTADETTIVKALAGSQMTIQTLYVGADLMIEYRLSGPGSLYGSDSDSAYGADSDPFYDGPGAWLPWPGSIVAANDVYQWRVTIGAGATQGNLSQFKVIIDAPDIVEYLNDIVIAAAGTIPAYTKNFTKILNIGATLQANGSGAETLEVDKTVNLAPVMKAYNSSHTAVSGASADIRIQGY